MRSRTLNVLVALVAVACAMLAMVELALLLSVPQGGYAWLVSLFPAAALVYGGVGALAWLRRPSNGIGAILVMGSLAWTGAGLLNTATPALVAAGLIVSSVPLAIVVHLTLAFPSGRLRDRGSVYVVLAAYATALLLQAPRYLFGAGTWPYTVLQVANRPDLVEAGVWLQRAVGGCVIVSAAAILFLRLRGTPAPRRRVLAPLFVYGIVAIPVAYVVGAAPGWFPNPVTDPFLIQITLLVGVPVAFVAVLLRGGFARAGQVQELEATLRERSDSRFDLRQALAQALGDESLELVYWAQSNGAYVDASGRPIELPSRGSDRGFVEVRLGHRRVGGIVYDAAMIGDPADVRTAAHVAALALDRGRLIAELRASGQRLRRSRARIAETADTERRRIARDLHDGLQARLVLAAMRADRVRGDPAIPAAGRAAADELHTELQASISELRGVVNGLMPAALTERGLFAATRELADAVPIMTELELQPNGHRLPPIVESVAYFVLLEAVNNAVKHSHAEKLHVRVGIDDGHLRIEVADNGIGAAQLNGSGLRGIADRLDTVEGHLTIESPAGRGTRLLAELPCAS